MPKSQAWQNAKKRLKYYTDKAINLGLALPAYITNLLKTKPSTPAEKRQLSRDINKALKGSGTVNRAGNLYIKGAEITTQSGQKIKLSSRDIDAAIKTTSKLGYNPLDNPVAVKQIKTKDKTVRDILKVAELRANPRYIDLRDKQFVYNLLKFANQMPEPYRAIFYAYVSKMSPADILDKAKDIAAQTNGGRLDFAALFNYWGNIYEDDSALIANAFSVNGEYMLSNWGISTKKIRSELKKYRDSHIKYANKSVSLNDLLAQFSLSDDIKKERRKLAKKYGVSLRGENN